MQAWFALKCKSSKPFGVAKQMASCHDPGTVLFWHVLLMLVAMSVQGQGWWCHSRALGSSCRAWIPTTGMVCACQVCDRPIPSFPIHLSLHSLLPSAIFVLSHLPSVSLGLTPALLGACLLPGVAILPVLPSQKQPRGMQGKA